MPFDNLDLRNAVLRRTMIWGRGTVQVWLESWEWGSAEAVIRTIEVFAEGRKEPLAVLDFRPVTDTAPFGGHGAEA